MFKKISWSYDNYILTRDEFGYHESAEFSRPYKENAFISNWYLELVPAAHNKEWLSVLLSTHLQFKTAENRLLKVNFKFYLTRPDGSVHTEKESYGPLELANYGSLGILYFIPRFKKSADLIHYEGYRIKCEVVIGPQEEPVKECQVTKSLGTLFGSPDFSDVTIIVEGKEILAHKTILAVRSPVFKAMFTNNMLESRKKSTEIRDIEYEVFMEMLHFIYTNKAPNIKKMAQKLLVAADMYHLDELKTMCAEELCVSLSIDNALDILLLSHLHKVTELMSEALKFVVKNINECILTDAFQSIIHTYPELVIQIMLDMQNKIEIASKTCINCCSNPMV